MPAAASGGSPGSSISASPAGAGESGATTQGASGAAGQSAAGDGGQAGTPGWAPDAPRVLTTVAKEGEWYARDPTQTEGLVMAPNGRLFFETAIKIYEIADGRANEYLTDGEALAAVGNQDGYAFGGLGFDQQGTLYATYAGSMIRSTAPHQLELWRAEAGSRMAPAQSLAVIGRDDVLAASTESIWRVTGQATATLLESFQPLDAPCSFSKLSLDASGAFMVLRDCYRQRVERGHFDGSRVVDLGAWFDGTFPASDLPGRVEFLCGASDPHAGFYLVVRQGKTTQLYYLAADATDTSGVSKITVSPSLDDAAAMSRDTQALHSTECNMAATSAGVIYLQSSMMLWRLAIQP